MTSLFDKASTVIHDLNQAKREGKELDRSLRIVGGLFLYSLVEGLWQDYIKTGHIIISECTHRVMSKVYEDNETAYTDRDQQELFDIAQSITESIIEFPTRIIGMDELECLYRLIEDGHEHDHRNRGECADYYWTKITEYLGRLYDSILAKPKPINEG